MVCTFCRVNIFQTTASWGYHRRSYRTDDLAVTREIQKCLFCSRLYQDSAEVLEGEAVVYRWTIRRSAATREDGAFVALTFRPSLAPESTSHIQPTPEDLPTRTFFLFDQSRHPQMPPLTGRRQADILQALSLLRPGLDSLPIPQTRGSRFRAGSRNVIEITNNVSSPEPELCNPLFLLGCSTSDPIDLLSSTPKTRTSRSGDTSPSATVGATQLPC